MAFPAYGVELKAGQTIKPSSPVTYALGGGQVTPYTVITPATPKVEGEPGIYTVTLANGRGVYTVTGEINTSQASSELQVVGVQQGSAKLGQKILFGNEGDTFVVIKAPTPDTPKQLEKRDPVERAVAVGAEAKVEGDNGVAIGAGASAKANSIAIGSDVEAGENEIVIGNGKATKVEVGGMDLMGIDKNVAGNRTNIDANTGNITTNAGNIATNSAHISTNVGNIATNTDNIVTNSSNINVNARDILNNKAGIAMAIALAHIPAATGGSRGSVGIGGGFFDGKEAIAIGASFRVGDRGQAKLGISHSSGETGGGVGVGFNF